MRLLLLVGVAAAERDSGTPVFATLGEASAPDHFWRPGVSVATGVPGHVAQHITLAGGRSRLMLTKDGGKTYAVVENVSNVAGDNENHPGDLGTFLPRTTSLRGLGAPGQFATLAGVRVGPNSAAGTERAVLQTWVDDADGLKLTGNASATFQATPGVPPLSLSLPPSLPLSYIAGCKAVGFLASTGCEGAAGSDGGCWLSSPSQTIIRTRNGSLLLSRYGYAADGRKMCGGGAKLCSTVTFYGSADGKAWRYVSRIDATAAMAAPDPRHGHSSKDIHGPGQASLALLGDGRVMAVFRLGPGTGTDNESMISPFFPGGNQGLNLWKAYSADSGATWTAPVAVTGCRGVRHDPKGVWPQLLMLSNGVLTLTTGRPNLAFWISSTAKSKTDPSAAPVADGECWSYAGIGAANPATPYGKSFGTSGYTGVAEVEPGVLLIAYDQLPVGAVGSPGPQRVYSIRANMTSPK